jgi:phosphonate degradation associated HDIG domain protein
MTAADPVRVIADLFAAEGAGEYLGEAATQAQHMLQAAALAEGAGAAPELVAAALLHDVGHFRGAVSGHQLMSGTDNQHGDQGADWLAQWFGPGVTEPVRLHVAAKRYLCAVEPGYFGGLSAASVHTLRIQGGPMTPAQSAEFEASPWCQAALRLRRWDDAAKDPEAIVPAFGYYQRLLRQLVRQREAGAPLYLDDHRNDHGPAPVTVVDPASDGPPDQLAQLMRVVDPVRGRAGQRFLDLRPDLAERGVVDT